MTTGAIELGGTKVIVAIGDDNGGVIVRERIPTGAPDDTVDAIAAFFATQAHGAIERVGVGAFGPIRLDRRASDYGHLLACPKPAWSGYDLYGALGRRLKVPVLLNTDVAAAGLGEYCRGALAGMNCGVYITVGTGIGASVLVDGVPLIGRLHPEIGHISLRRADGDMAQSLCRFHHDCAEGLACGPAILQRAGQPLSAFAPGDAEFELVADYLGQLCATITLMLSPHRIVLGGGVGKTQGLHERVAGRMMTHLNGYAVDNADPKDSVVPPTLGDDAGIIGALELAGSSQIPAK